MRAGRVGVHNSVWGGHIGPRGCGTVGVRFTHAALALGLVLGAHQMASLREGVAVEDEEDDA